MASRQIISCFEERPPPPQRTSVMGTKRNLSSGNEDIGYGSFSFAAKTSPSGFDKRGA